MEFTEKNVIVLENGETFDNMNDAMLKGIENDMRKFADKKLYYDYGKIASNFILDNKKEVYQYLRTLLNLADELDENGELIKK